MSVKALMVVPAMLACYVATAAAQTDNFYQGKTIKMVLPTAPGGSTSLYGLLMGEHLQRHIPGNPPVVSEYRVGAAGVVAANYVYNAAPKDGTVITMLIAGLLAEDTQASLIRFDSAKFGYIGRAADLPRAIVAWHTTGVDSMDKARLREVAFGGSGRGGLTSIAPLLLNEILGTKFKIISGYTGSGPTYLALERGEIDATTVAWEGLVAQHSDWLRDGKIKVLATIGSRKFVGLDNVPRMESLGRNAKETELLVYSAHSADLGQALAAPPGIPAERLQTLRRAFDAMVKDPAFIASTKEKRVEIEPMTGEALQKLVEDAAKRTPDISERMRALAAE